jgi:hypothetical protein
MFRKAQRNLLEKFWKTRTINLHFLPPAFRKSLPARVELRDGNAAAHLETALAFGVPRTVPDNEW